MEYFNNETIKFQTPVSTCQISDGPGFGPTHDLLMEYFNTETIKFQTSVSTCRISDGPGFGPTHACTTDGIPTHWNYQVSDTSFKVSWWSTCYILQSKLQINVHPWRCNLFNHLRAKKLTQCMCCCENYKVIRSQNYWLIFSFRYFLSNN